MKKILYLSLLLLTIFIGTNNVFALDNKYVSNFYDDYTTYSTIDDTIINNLITYYNNNLSSTYDYYFITLTNNNTSIVLRAVNLNNVYYDITSNGTFGLVGGNASTGVSYYYSFTNESYSFSNGISSIWPSILYSTNVDFTFVDSSSCGSANASSNCYDSLTIPSYSNLALDVSYPQLDISNGDTIPTYQSLTTGTTPTGFTTVNLSSYDYIILSLKDYSQEPFNTTIYTQGSLCLTPVYNYGMQQKQESYPGYQVQGCTEVYSSETPVNVYIIQSDLTNHAIYYIKQQPNTPTTLKIPTSIFNITYINVNNTDPQVMIEGRSYPVIPYSDLTDTANKSTDEGYISGRTCALGDVNCQADAMGMDISDLFTSPLTLLQTVWTSITSIFTIIASFITILPPTLQVFLYTSFMLGIILGIIKIIL